VIRSAIVLCRDKHEPVGAYGAMFRCAARLQLQYPQHIWRAAFREHPPYLYQVIRDCQRYGVQEYILLPWHLEPYTTTLPQGWQCAPPLGQHPLMQAIVTQRALEAHYTHQPQAALTRALNEQTWYVHAAHATVAGITSMDVATLATRLSSAPPTLPLVVQPLALSQLDPLYGHVQTLIAEQAREASVHVAKAIEYDRRLIEIVVELVRPLLGNPA
jgi:hypothetical protein